MWAADTRRAARSSRALDGVSWRLPRARSALGGLGRTASLAGAAKLGRSAWARRRCPTSREPSVIEVLCRFIRHLVDSVTCGSRWRARHRFVKSLARVLTVRHRGHSKRARRALPKLPSIAAAPRDAQRHTASKHGRAGQGRGRARARLKLRQLRRQGRVALRRLQLQGPRVQHW